MTGEATYDAIGRSYAGRRRPDPRLAAAILDALGDARTVVNVGAGAGSYEPADRYVLAVEPSLTMIRQRPPDAVPAVIGRAEALPLDDGAVDAAMAILTLHHWDDRERGVAELCRVARERVVIVTYDHRVSEQLWLMADYAPEIARLEREIFPAPEQVAGWIGDAHVVPLPLPADCTDHMLGSFWCHPERVLDPEARAATSGFARLDDAVERRIVEAVRADLESGAWDERHGHLRGLAAYDAGLRLVAGRLEPEGT